MAGERVQVFGAGGHAKVVIATLTAAGHDVVAVWDDDAARWGGTCLGVPIRGATAAADDLPTILAIGDNRARARLASAMTRRWMTVIHPTAHVHPSVTLGPGTVVFAGAIVQPDARLGAHVIVNTAATVDHDCVL